MSSFHAGQPVYLGRLRIEGSAFTVSGGPGGDKSSTLAHLFTFAMQHGVLWMGQSKIPFNDKGINRRHAPPVRRYRLGRIWDYVARNIIADAHYRLQPAHSCLCFLE